MNSFKLAGKKKKTLSRIILYRVALQKHYGSLLGSARYELTDNNERKSSCRICL